MIASKQGVQPAIVHWGYAARALRRGAESGDLHVVLPRNNGALIAVIDGLGHGAEAATAARIAAAAIELCAEEPIADIVQQCHAVLQRTRGVVLSMVSLDGASDQMIWIGVGNVEAGLYRVNEATRPRRESLLLQGGVVGYLLPRLRPATLSIYPGDILVLATDGISDRFSTVSPYGREPQEVADDILARYGEETDDALVLVARYLGSQS
jgi:phosphoserine phosphatase RsbX